MPSVNPNVFVMVQPNADKQERVRETISSMTSVIKEKEPWVSSYHIYSVANQGENKDITDYYVMFQ